MMGLSGGSRKYREASRLRILGCAGRRWAQPGPRFVEVRTAAEPLASDLELYLGADLLRRFPSGVGPEFVAALVAAVRRQP